MMNKNDMIDALEEFESDVKLYVKGVLLFRSNNVEETQTMSDNFISLDTAMNSALFWSKVIREKLASHVEANSL